MPVSPELRAVYDQQRRALLAALTAAAAHAFREGHADQGRTIGRILGLVEAGQAAMVRLVDGYMGLATGAQPHGLAPVDYTPRTLRSQDPVRVYSQPWAAQVAALERGETADGAMFSGLAKLEKLGSTDLQLAQTHAARDWMQASPGVTGWMRVLDSTACSLCQAAAGQVYHTSDLMPIHEHCGCGVEPITEGSPRYAAINASVRVASSDIGPRLMAEDWSA